MQAVENIVGLFYDNSEAHLLSASKDVSSKYWKQYGVLRVLHYILIHEEVKTSFIKEHSDRDMDTILQRVTSVSESDLYEKCTIEVFEFLVSATIKHLSHHHDHPSSSYHHSVSTAVAENLCKVFYNHHTRSSFDVSKLIPLLSPTTILMYIGADKIAASPWWFLGSQEHQDTFIVDCVGICINYSHLIGKYCNLLKGVLGKKCTQQEVLDLIDKIKYPYALTKLVGVLEIFVQRLDELGDLSHTLDWIDQCEWMGDDNNSHRKRCYHALAQYSKHRDNVQTVLWLKHAIKLTEVWPVPDTLSELSHLVFTLTHHDSNAAKYATFKKNVIGNEVLWGYCALVLGLEQWEPDTEMYNELEENERLATEYCDLLDNTCASLKPSCGRSCWWSSCLEVLLASRSDARLSVQEVYRGEVTHLGHLASYVKASSQEVRDSLKAVLNASEFKQEMFAKNKVTYESLKDVPTVVNIIQRYVDERLGGSATVQAALEFFDSTGQVGSFATPQQMKQYVQLSPFLGPALAAFGSRSVSCLADDPVVAIFHSKSPQELQLQHFQRLNKTVLKTMKVRQLEFLIRYASESSKKVREFASTYANKLPKLPDIIRRQCPKNMWIATKVMGILELVKTFTAGNRAQDVIKHTAHFFDDPTQDHIQAMINITELLPQLVDIIKLSSTAGEQAGLQNIISAVANGNLRVQLKYNPNMSVKEMMAGCYDFTLPGHPPVEDNQIDHCLRTCSIMTPTTQLELRVNRFTKLITATRFLVATLARLLFEQRHEVLLVDPGSCDHMFDNMFQVYPTSITLHSRIVSETTLIECVRKVERIVEQSSSHVNQGYRRNFPHLAMFTDVELEKLQWFLDKRSTNMTMTDAEDHVSTLVLRFGITRNVAIEMLVGARDTVENKCISCRTAALLMPPPSQMTFQSAGSDTPLLQAKTTTTILHTSSDSPYQWTIDLLRLYHQEVNRRPTYGEVIAITTESPVEIGRSIRLAIQKASYAPPDRLVSIVIATNSSPTSDSAVVANLRSEIQNARATGRSFRRLHIFLTADVDYFKWELGRIDDGIFSEAPPIYATTQDNTLRSYYEHVPVKVFSTDSVRQGKSTAIQQQGGGCHHVTLLDGDSEVDLVQKLQKFKNHGSHATTTTLWLELGCILSHKLVAIMFNILMLGGVSTDAGISIVTHNDINVCVEVPCGVLAQILGLAILQRAAFVERPPPTLINAVCPDVLTGISCSEIRHGVAKFVQFAQSQPRYDDLIKCVYRTAAAVCSPDAAPQVDSSSWGNRGRHIPSSPSYLLTWAAEGGAPLIISNNATQRELQEVVDVPVHDISTISDQEQLQRMFLLSIGAVVSPENLAKLHGYVVTKHVLMNAIRISLAMRSGCCPCVTVGETGCGKTHLVKIIAICLGYELISVDINPGLTWLPEARVRVGDTPQSGENQSLKLRLQEAKSNHQGNPRVMVFFDELNTWAKQDIIKCLMIDRRYEDFELPVEWFVLGACNPYKLSSNTGELCYNVQSVVHPSIAAYCWSFGACDAEEETHIVATICKNNIDCEGEPLLPSTVTELFIKHIPAAHNFFRKNLEERVVSFRDPIRVVRLYTEAGTVLRRVVGVDNITDIEVAKIAFILVYLVGIDSKLPQRKAFSECFIGLELDPLLARVATAVTDLILNANNGSSSSVVRHAALEETMLVVVTCIFTRTPVMIIGPPGTGKSLAPHLITDALASSFGASGVLVSLQSVIHFNYQCSGDTRASALDDAFTTAHKADKDNNFRTISAVIVDELGLADGAPERPLKVLNKWLDQEGVSHSNPYPAFIGTCNSLKDRSLLNRSVCLFRQLPDEAALVAMIRAVPNERLQELAEKIAKVVFDSSQGINRDDRKLFGMRDLYALLKDVSTRNQLGTMTAADVNKAVVRCCGHDPLKLLKNIEIDKFVMLREAITTSRPSSISAGPQQGGSGNTLDESIFPRPLMIEAESFSLVLGMLEVHMGARKVFVCGGMLKEDPSMFSYHIQQVMMCMEAGIPCVVFKCSYLYEALMAVLSGCFVKTGEKQLARITVDGESEYVSVSPGFHMITVMMIGARHQLSPIENSAAFADRFERHDLHYHSKTIKPLRKLLSVPDLNNLVCHIDRRLLQDVEKVVPRILCDALAQGHHEFIFGFHFAIFHRFVPTAHTPITTTSGNTTASSQVAANRGKEKQCLETMLRLIDVPRFVTVVMGLPHRKYTIQQCMKAAEYIYKKQRLGPILQHCSLVCGILTTGETFSDPQQIQTKLSALAPTDNNRLSTAKILGPYSVDTPDGLIHLETSHYLATDNSNAIVLVHMDPTKISTVLSYQLYALCEHLQRNRGLRSRIMIVVSLPQGTPTAQLDLHPQWNYVLINTLSTSEECANKYIHIRQQVLTRYTDLLPSNCQQLRTAIQRLMYEKCEFLVEIKRRYRDLVAPIVDDAVRTTINSNDHRVTDYASLQSEVDQLTEAACFFFAVTAIHRTNISWAFRDDKQEEVDFMNGRWLPYMAQLGKWMLESQPDSIVLPHAVHHMILGGGLDTLNMDNALETVKKKTTWPNHFFAHQLVLEFGCNSGASKFFGGQYPAISKERLKQCLHLHMMTSTIEGAMETYVRPFKKKPALYTPNRAFIHFEAYGPYCPEWLFTWCTTFAGKSPSCPDDNQLWWERGDRQPLAPSRLPTWMLDDSSYTGEGCQLWMDYMVFLLRHFPKRLEEIILLPLPVSNNNNSAAASTSSEETDDDDYHIKDEHLLIQIKEGLLTMASSPAGGKDDDDGNTSSLLDHTFSEDGIKRGRTHSNCYTSLLSLYRTLEEYDWGTRLQLLSDIAYHLQMFLDGAFTTFQWSLLRFKDLPLLVRTPLRALGEMMPTLAFNDQEMVMNIYPYIKSAIVEVVSQYNSMVEKAVVSSGVKAQDGTQDTTLHLVVPPTVATALDFPAPPKTSANVTPRQSVGPKTRLVKRRHVRQAMMTIVLALDHPNLLLDTIAQSYFRTLFVGASLYSVAFNSENDLEVIPEFKLFRPVQPQNEGLLPFCLQESLSENVAIRVKGSRDFRRMVVQYGSALIKQAISSVASQSGDVFAQANFFALLNTVVTQPGTLDELKIQFGDELRVANLAHILKAVRSAGVPTYHRPT